MRTFWVVMTAALLLSTAVLGGEIDFTNGLSGPTGDKDEDIVITCEVPAYSQVLWGAGEWPVDLAIDFGSPDYLMGPNGDAIADRSNGDNDAGTYYPVGAGHPGTGWPGTQGDWRKTKEADDAWAWGYYESLDQVEIYVATNTDMTMTVAPQGLLKNATDDKMPSWFTMAGNGLADPDGPGGFLWNGAVKSGGELSGSNPGRYFAAKSDKSLTMDGYCTAFDDQDCLEMDGGPFTADFDAPTQGTIAFKSRILRVGMNDGGGQQPAGTYTGTITVTFAQD